jgi:hypothetical protein
MQKVIRFKKPKVLTRFGDWREVQTDRFDTDFLQRTLIQPEGIPISFSKALQMKMQEWINIEDRKSRVEHWHTDLISYWNAKGFKIIVEEDEYELI